MRKDKLRVLSLFSGAGGMDIGFEGGFVAHRKSFPADADYVSGDGEWIRVDETGFDTVFADDILQEAERCWTRYMRHRGKPDGVFRRVSVVELVKRHNSGESGVFPDNIDVVTGGFPCQDFSVAGKRMGFNSKKDDYGQLRESGKPSEESRGKLYFWMKQVIDIVRPKVFIAENVKGLVSLGDARDIIRRDFAGADGDDYIVLEPRVMHAGDYGVPESRERVIFIGIRKDALTADALAALSSDGIPSEFDPYPPQTHACTAGSIGTMPVVTTADVLCGLSEPAESDDVSQKAFSKCQWLSKGQGQTEIKLDGLGPTIRSEHHGNIEFRRLSAEHGGRHADELAAGLPERRLTVRECALIQTFPPDYEFVHDGSDGIGSVSGSGAYKVIGNAVPPVLAYNIAKRLSSLWDLYFGN